MKTKISLLLSFILMATISSFAQAPQRRTVEERVKSVMEKLSALNLDQSQVQKTDSVFVDYYKAQEKMREDARASGERPDRSVFEKMTNDRNEKLKAIFTADQITKYKNEVEATLRPQRQRSQGN
jgi:uncharacterized protein YbcC (UPF0753/DUF2309 family)